MSIIIMAAIVASAQAAPAQGTTAQPMDHSKHQQMGENHDAKADCPCCQHMADGKKMVCCEKHEKAETGEHAGHSSH
jgi:hypothetical protein